MTKKRQEIKTETFVRLRKPTGELSPYVGVLLPGRQHIASNKALMATMTETARVLASEGFRLVLETEAEGQ